VIFVIYANIGGEVLTSLDAFIPIVVAGDDQGAYFKITLYVDWSA
jgi:hypothetical protein